MSAATSTRTRAGESRPPTPTAPRPADRNWRDRAACRSVDPELFQPSTESGPAHNVQVAEAKAVWRDLLTGWRYLARRRGLLGLSLFYMLYNFLNNFGLVLTPPLL